MLRRAAALTAAGVAAGLAVAGLAGRAVSSYLYGVSATDLPTWVATSAVLAAVTLSVSAFPARRAARIDPVAVLKDE